MQVSYQEIQTNLGASSLTNLFAINSLLEIILPEARRSESDASLV